MEEILAVRDTAAEETEYDSNSSEINCNIVQDFNKMAEEATKPTGKELLPKNIVSFPRNYSLVSSIEQAIPETSMSHVSHQDSNIIIEGDENISLQGYRTFVENPEILFIDKAVDIPNNVGADKIDQLLSNQNTILNILGQILVLNENMQQEIAAIKGSLNTTDYSAGIGVKNSFLCLENFPIDVDRNLEEFNNNLKDNSYKDLMVSC